MQKVVVGLLLCLGALGIASACDGYEQCDSDGCASGTYHCPDDCANKHVSSINVRTLFTLLALLYYPAYPACPSFPRVLLFKKEGGGLATDRGSLNVVCVRACVRACVRSE